MKLGKDDLNQILDRNVGWIENCDNKASVMLGSFGVAISILFAFDYATIILDVLKEKIANHSAIDVLFVLLSFIFLGIFIFGISKLVQTLVPKTDIFSEQFKADKNTCTNSVVFYSSIARNSSYTKYKNHLKSYSDTEYENDIASQIYICAKICDTKFKNYKKGLYFSMTGLLGFMVLIALGYWS